jgi:thioredoxin 2
VSVNSVSTTVVQCPVCGRKNRVPAAAPGIPRCGQCKTALPWITDAGDHTFADVVEKAVLPVLVDLWAPWCGPCRMVSPTLERLARDMAGRIKLVKVNVDEAPNLARRFSVQGIPTLLVMVNGQEKARQTGAAPEHVLRSWLERGLADSSSPV